MLKEAAEMAWIVNRLSQNFIALNGCQKLGKKSTEFYKNY